MHASEKGFLKVTAKPRFLWQERKF